MTYNVFGGTLNLAQLNSKNIIPNLTQLTLTLSILLHILGPLTF